MKQLIEVTETSKILIVFLKIAFTIEVSHYTNKKILDSPSEDLSKQTTKK